MQFSNIVMVWNGTPLLPPHTPALGTQLLACLRRKGMEALGYEPQLKDVYEWSFKVKAWLWYWSILCFLIGQDVSPCLLRLLLQWVELLSFPPPPAMSSMPQWTVSPGTMTLSPLMSGVSSPWEGEANTTLNMHRTCSHHHYSWNDFSHSRKKPITSKHELPPQLIFPPPQALNWL